MKKMIALLSLLVMTATVAEPLEPITSEEETCEATLYKNTYEVEAACWRNREGEARLWFTSEAFSSLRETRINTKYIKNLEEACSQTAEYEYEDLIGDNKLDESEVEVNLVTIEYHKLDTSACFED